MRLCILVLSSFFLFIEGIGAKQKESPKTDLNRLEVEKAQIVFPKNRWVHSTRFFRYPNIKNEAQDEKLEKIQKMLNVSNVLEESLDQILDSNDTQLSYSINWNGQYVFDISYVGEGMGAHLGYTKKHFLINLKTGDLITFKETFDEKQLSQLKEHVKQKRQQNIDKKRRDLKKDPSLKGAEEHFDSCLKDATLDFIDIFSIGKNGITFKHEFSFPYAFKVLEPDGDVTFSFKEILPYLKESGVLGKIVKDQIKK